jgi:hypothetical protein
MHGALLEEEEDVESRAWSISSLQRPALDQSRRAHLGDGLLELHSGAE